MSRSDGRVLALDVGDVRVGLALSDPLGITAQPIGSFRRSGPGKDMQQIRELVERHRVEKIVVGHPLLLSGEAGSRARKTQGFAARLREQLAGVPVELWDERLTTVQAERAMIEGGVRRRKRKAVVDSLAAVVILQSYLDAASDREMKPHS